MAGLPTVKVLLCGNGSVGKSSIIQRLVSDGFAKAYKQTVGCDFFERRMDLKGDHSVVLQVWDVGGQSVASGMLPKYLHETNLLMLCYDITDARSLQDLEDWWGRIDAKFAATQPQPPQQQQQRPTMYLLGNKIDLAGQRQVSEAQHDQWVRAHGLAGGFFVSARSGEHVLRVFGAVAAKAIGVTLTDYDLAFLDRVLQVDVDQGGGGRDEGRTSIADQIEAEDCALEEARRRREEVSTPCQCAVC